MPRDLGRVSPFSYACAGCGRCCSNRLIPLTPYEVVRLARHKGLSTTAFLGRYTQAGGAFLAHAGEDGACVLLEGQSCSVHRDRPLACRLYPLGRLETPEFEPSEVFFEVEPHPETEGTYGTEGTVADFLEAQDAAPFLRARALYAELHSQIEEELARPVAEEDAKESVSGLPRDLLDLDAVVEAHCRRHHLTPPEQSEALMQMHLAAVREILGGRRR